MKCLDPGHSYILDSYSPNGATKYTDGNRLDFIKKIGDGFPGNRGQEQIGTNCQEVLRAVIDRVSYLREQAIKLEDADSVEDDDAILLHLRSSLLIFETRAARVKGEPFPSISQPIESLLTCSICGHVYPHIHELKV